MKFIPTIEDDEDIEMEQDFDDELNPEFLFEEKTIKKVSKKEVKSSHLDQIIENKRKSLSGLGIEVGSNDEGKLDVNLQHIENLSKLKKNEKKERYIEDKVVDKRIKEFFEEAPVVGESLLESFNSLSLSRPILKSISAMGFVSPTPIQSRSIPIALQGRDICASAVTGSGKTAAFLIPALERLLYRPKAIPATRVLILVPTRELGSQCHKVAVGLSQHSSIHACLCVGGLPPKAQEVELSKKPDMVIATPGRLIDHIYNTKSFSLDQIEILVLDEADRMLEQGFQAELEEIIKHTPKKRQTMLFSATMTENVDELIKLSLNKPVRLFVDSSDSMTTRLVQEFIRVRQQKEESRPAILAALCSRTYTSDTLIFFRSKAAAHHMKIIFGLLGLKAAELHGNLNQNERLESLEKFREKQVDFLMATDLASRGLDITGIKTVINYDMPSTYQVYVHRCGRTARGSSAGKAVSLVGEVDRPILKLALKNSRDEVKNRVVPSLIIQKFEEKIASFKDIIKEVYEEEKEEKQMNKAEMEMEKLENRMEHEDEIKSRPAKVWFQTEKEKKKEKENSKKQVIKDKIDVVNRSKLDGMARRKKRLYQARLEDKDGEKKQKLVAKKAKALKKPQKMNQLAIKSSKSQKSKVSKKSGFSQEKRK